MARTIRKQGRAKMVEWDNLNGEVERVILPIEAEVTDEEVKQGIPVFSFAELLDGLITPVTEVDVENALHKRGIYLPEELVAKPNLVRAALLDAIGTNLSIILRTVNGYLKTMKE